MIYLSCVKLQNGVVLQRAVNYFHNFEGKKFANFLIRLQGFCVLLKSDFIVVVGIHFAEHERRQLLGTFGFSLLFAQETIECFHQLVHFVLLNVTVSVDIENLCNRPFFTPFFSLDKTAMVFKEITAHLKYLFEYFCWGALSHNKKYDKKLLKVDVLVSGLIPLKRSHYMLRKFFHLVPLV